MLVSELIKNLKSSNLYAENLCCGHEFKLADALLFDGTKPFPQEAQEIQTKLKSDLEKRNKTLEKKIKRATETNIKTTRATNVGNFLELAVPTAKDFKWVVPDSKYLGRPIDLLVFNGLSNGKVKSLSFVEVKTGEADLNDHQESVKEAIEEKKVSYKVFT